MKILITGANGFVGSHLVRALNADHQVVALIRRDVHVEGAAETRTVPSINSATNWDGLLGDIDIVVHAAARVHVMKETAEDPLEAFRETNYRGTKRLAEACAAQGVKRLVFLSSIKVNGEETLLNPFTATDLPRPVDPYGLSKKEAEDAVMEVAAKTNMTAIILRPTVVYGPEVKGNIARLIRLINTRLPIPLARADNARSVLSIRNLIMWVEEAIRTSEPPRLPVIIADPQPISTPGMIRSLAQGMGIRPRLMSVPVPFLNLAATLLGQRSALQRLLGNLAVEPTVDAFPGLDGRLLDPNDELVRLGQQLRAAGSQHS